MSDMPVVELLNRLEHMISRAPRLPVVNRTAIDAAKALELLDQVRIHLPEEVKRAQSLLSEQERILDEARRNAEAVSASAQQRIKALARESEIVKAAEEECSRMIEEAKLAAKEMRDGADDYAERALGQLEEAVQRVLRAIKRGKEELGRR